MHLVVKQHFLSLTSHPPLKNNHMHTHIHTCAERMYLAYKRVAVHEFAIVRTARLYLQNPH